MYTAVTAGIQVTVTPQYSAERSQPEHDQFFWTYTVEIANTGERLVQLISRHWLITDARGKVEEIQGLGVVGEQPVLQPGEAFQYTSGCPLSTASGIMAGTYRMVDEAGSAFDVAIPAFSLDRPGSNTRVN